MIRTVLAVAAAAAFAAHAHAADFYFIAKGYLDAGLPLTDMTCYAPFPL